MPTIKLILNIFLKDKFSSPIQVDIENASILNPIPIQKRITKPCTLSPK